jgi:hypothetical protein
VQQLRGAGEDARRVATPALEDAQLGGGTNDDGVGAEQAILAVEELELGAAGAAGGGDDAVGGVDAEADDALVGGARLGEVDVLDADGGGGAAGRERMVGQPAFLAAGVVVDLGVAVLEAAECGNGARE